jgi:hypothetical protein
MTLIELLAWGFVGSLVLALLSCLTKRTWVSWTLLYVSVGFLTALVGSVWWAGR